MAFEKQFPLSVADIKPSVECLKDACNELKSSKKFFKIMEIILNAGNFLNGGKANGQAFGFKLSTLSKLADTRSVDNKMSLLTYLVIKIQTKFPNLMDFPDDLLFVKKACTISQSQLSTDIASLGKSLKDIDASIKNIPKIEGIKDLFHRNIPKFVREAKDEFEEILENFEKAKKDFETLAGLWGDNPKLATSDTFFQSIQAFILAFQGTIKELEKKKAKEEKQRKRELEEEKKRLALEEKKKKSSKEDKPTEEKDDMGIMDNTLAKLRGGQAFQEKKNRTN